MFSPTRILVPTDMSMQADRAIRVALDIAKIYDSEVLVFHAIIDPTQYCTVDYCPSEELIEQFTAESMEAAHRTIRNQLAKFRSMGDINIRTVIRTGVPHDMILKEAADEEIDLIVLTAEADTVLGRQFMGNVANHLLRGAKCQVLLVQ